MIGLTDINNGTDFLMYNIKPTYLAAITKRINVQCDMSLITTKKPIKQVSVS